MESKKPTESIQFPIKINRTLSLPNVATLLVIMSYVFGYLIHSMYIRSLGVSNIPLLKAEYVESGLVFIILSLAIVFMPSILWYVIAKNKKYSGLPPEGSKRTTATAFIFTIILLFFAVFITGADWNGMAHPMLGNNVSFRLVFHLYLIMTFLGLVFLGGLNRFYLSVKKRDWWQLIIKHEGLEKKVTSAVNWVVNAGRWLLLGVGVFFTTLTLYRIPWAIDLIVDMGYYFMMLIFTAYIIHRVKSRIKKLTKVEGTEKLRSRLSFVTGVVSLILVYLVIFAYTFGVYEHIPSNRGGKRSVTTTTFLFAKDTPPELICLISSANSKPDPATGSTSIPLKILDQTDNEFYVMKGDERPLTAKAVFVVKKDNVEAVTLNPIIDCSQQTIRRR